MNPEFGPLVAANVAAIIHRLLLVLKPLQGAVGVPFLDLPTSVGMGLYVVCFWSHS